MPFADVALARPLRQTFQYEVPGALEWDVAVGTLVEVEFSNHRTEGCVTALSPTLRPELEGKRVLPILRIINPGYHVPQDVIELAQWMADYYYCGVGEALHCVSTIGFNEARARKVHVLSLRRPDLWDAHRREETPQWKALKPRQRELVEAFLNSSNSPLTRRAIHDDLGISVAVVSKLLHQGVLEEKETELERTGGDAGNGGKEAGTLEPPILLNAHQAAAFDRIAGAIDTRRYGAFLLHGVTGSGKTEVYLQAIARVLEHGRQAIALVPEIALTPQTVDRFRRRFGPRVGVCHSRLTINEKFDLWRAIQEGQVSVVVGARSALFAPFPSLGLIVIDEEHEPSYKQSDPAPRYNARDVAVVRARQRNAAVILGTATPSMESYYNCNQGKYVLLKLPHRVSQLPLATTRLVDMGEEAALRKNTSLLSQALRASIADRLAKKEQTILFLNRRGFSNFQICWSCRAISKCLRCDASLTYHKGLDRLVCHYCDRSVQPLKTCPSCNSEEMKMIGMGTERVEELIAQDFPAARLIRIDLDTTGHRDAFIEAWNRITSGEVDIILGTQMIAKGLHLENVTLVGVISADFALFQPDFRAAERAFCLLTQVTGRAGRGDKPGEVIIQTYQPRHYSIVHATRQDYEGFYEREIRSRYLMRFPPYQRLISLLFSDVDHDKAAGAARECANVLKRNASPYRGEGLAVFGATPAPISRLRGRFRYQILMRAEKPGLMRHILAKSLDEWRDTSEHARVSLTIDVDPIDLL